MEEDKDKYEWQRSKFLINGLNESVKHIAASYLNVGDDSMSVVCFQTTAKGDLPHVSYIFLNPEPLGTYFKTVICYITGAFLFIET